MNFTSFGNQTFPVSMPGIAQFPTTTAPLVSTTTAATVATVSTITQPQQQEQGPAGTNSRFQQPHATTTIVNMAHFNQSTMPVGSSPTVATLPAKFRTNTNDDMQDGASGSGEMTITGDKYSSHLVTVGTVTDQQQQQEQQYTPAQMYIQPSEDKRIVATGITYPQSVVATEASPAAVTAAPAPISLMGTTNSENTLQATVGSNTQQQQQLQQHQQQTVPQELTQDLCNAILHQQGVTTKRVLQNSSWQPITTGNTVADYLSNLPANALPLSLHQLLKYSAETIKKENQNIVLQVQTGGSTPMDPIDDLGTVTIPIPQQSKQQQSQQLMGSSQIQHQQQLHAANVELSTITAVVGEGSATITSNKKKKRKKRPREQKPKLRPGEIRLTTALDGSPLYMCPECQVAYPESDLLEIHLVGHNLERRYICDVCQTALKRKDHLTRHKQSHNPERPFICNICLKAFKRKEQLSLHFVIHSGEKRHLCHECGKGFYRKDHLRKHTRSHIARRVKAELSMQNQRENGMSMLRPAIPTSALAAVQLAQQRVQQQQQQQQQDSNHQQHFQPQPVQQQHRQSVVAQQ